MLTKTDRRAARRERKRYGHKTKVVGRYAADIIRRRLSGDLPPSPPPKAVVTGGLHALRETDPSPHHQP